MPNWIGDAVMALPALRSISENYPEAKIFVATNKSCSEIYRYINFDIEHLLLLEKNKILANAKKIKNMKFDLMVYFTNSFSTALEGFLAGVKYRVGYSKDCRRLLLSNKVESFSVAGQSHHRFYYNNIAQFITGHKTDSDLPKLRKSSNPSSVLIKNGWDPGKRLIGINPGAAFGSAKRWIPSRFAEVACYFIEKGFQVVIFSAGGLEKVTADAIAEKADGIINLSGRTTLSELIEIIGFCNLFLTNDSGPMHIAAALGVPIVAIFGPTNKDATAPSGGNYRIVSTGESCSPCMKRECPLKHHNCMVNITSTMVIESMNAALGGK